MSPPSGSVNGARELFIGLMTGTSLDGVDAVLADCAPRVPASLAHVHTPMPPALRDELLALNASGADEIHRSSHGCPGSRATLCDDSHVTARGRQAEGQRSARDRSAWPDGAPSSRPRLHRAAQRSRAARGADRDRRGGGLPQPRRRGRRPGRPARSGVSPHRVRQRPAARGREHRRHQQRHRARWRASHGLRRRSGQRADRRLDGSALRCRLRCRRRAGSDGESGRRTRRRADERPLLLRWPRRRAPEGTCSRSTGCAAASARGGSTPGSCSRR